MDHWDQPVFEDYVYRSHLQTAIWKAALDADPLSLDPVHHGWSLDELSEPYHQLLVKC